MVGGRITYDGAARARRRRRSTSRAGCCPAWSTRTATSGWTPTERSTGTTEAAGARRPRRRRPAAARRRFRRRHPLGRRARGPAPAGPGRPAHRPAASGTSATTRTRSSRPSLPTYVARRGPPRRRLGQAGRGLDRPRGRRSRALLARWTRWTRRCGRARRRGPGDRPLLRRGLRCRDLVEAGIDCIEHGTGLTDETIAAAGRSAGVPIVPTLVNIANFPHIADGGRGALPGVRRPHAPAARSGATRRWPRPTRPASRCSSAPTPAARCRTAWWRRRSPSSSAPACRPRPPSTRPAGGPRRGCGRPGAGGGGAGRPGGLPRRPARGRRRPRRPAAGRDARPARSMIMP